MATEIEKYIHQNTKTSHKRWESIVMYALHFALKDVQLRSQYKIGPYLVDGYFPDLNLVVEIDEEHHDSQIEDDRIREAYIQKELGCEFYRIDVKEPVYEQVDQLIAKVRSCSTAEWAIEAKVRKEGDYSKQKREELEEVGAFDFLNCLQEDLEQLDIKIDRNHIGTPLTPPNGEVGFMIHFDGLTLCMIVTKSLKPKLLVTDYAETIPEYLSLELSDWKNTTGNKYKVIENFKGQKSRDDVFEYLKNTLNQLLKR
ncbi:endonuclease domain-containing protein [Vibrio crassostreae]|uniref:endonuclease domain-containing protein n=1 Tax=Vibrio crassostreae TaxID=246167 RepID=UPI0010538247|nr:DUF559 domain-containing protein [Vibrio crassostreae]